MTFNGFKVLTGEPFKVGRVTVQPWYMIGQDKATGEWVQLSGHATNPDAVPGSVGFGPLPDPVATFLSEVAPGDQNLVCAA